MARLVHLEELCVTVNSRLVVDAMLVYFQRDAARDMQYATHLTKLWKELVDRVTYGIGEADCRNAYLGDQEELICYADAKFVKWLWYGKWAGDFSRNILTDAIMEQSRKILQKKIAELQKGKMSVEDDMDWYIDEIREQA
ncbi:hypothetical protein Tco_0702101 [Tanacetum coccineum]|uniref:Uncharacterized protein n=1 Tax=Tanacetum coccineum TaxID=301880 RepID=A0ABQ4XW29_9ASTR